MILITKITAKTVFYTEDGKPGRTDRSNLGMTHHGTVYIDGLGDIPLTSFPVLKFDSDFCTIAGYYHGFRTMNTRKTMEKIGYSEFLECTLKEEAKETNRYIVRVGHNLCLIVSKDFTTRDFEWAKANGLPFYEE